MRCAGRYARPPVGNRGFRSYRYNPLSVDGVAPTVENIRSGEYPLITQLYAVTRKGEENPNVALFLDWVTSDAGMELIEKTGYVAER